MLTLILLVLILLTMFLEFVGVALATRYLVAALKRKMLGKSYLRDTNTLAIVFTIQLASHLLQIALWAGAFMLCGEFSDASTAFYHSAVNFASLGYGDIVMSDDWRLLGAIEAAVGVMMFGMSAAVLFAATSKVLMIRLNAFTGSTQNSPQKKG